MCFYFYEAILDYLFGKKPIEDSVTKTKYSEGNTSLKNNDYEILSEEERKLIAEKRLKAESLKPSEVARMITERRKREEEIERKIERLAQRFECLHQD